MPRLMVAVDGSENAKLAVYMAISMADRKSDQIFVVSVIPTWDGTTDFNYSLDAKRAETVLKARVQLVANAGVRASSLPRERAVH